MLKTRPMVAGSACNSWRASTIRASPAGNPMSMKPDCNAASLRSRDSDQRKRSPAATSARRDTLLAFSRSAWKGVRMSSSRATEPA